MQGRHHAIIQTRYHLNQIVPGHDVAVHTCSASLYSIMHHRTGSALLPRQY